VFMNINKSLLTRFSKIAVAILLVIAFTVSAVSCVAVPIDTSFDASDKSEYVSGVSNTASDISEESSAEPSKEPSEEPSQPQKSSLEVHFIDVGQADSALILCDGKAMLIDGGNTGDSSVLYTYLKKQNIKHLDYVIGTHAHEDHIGGIPGALNFATVGTAYSPVTDYDSKAFENFKKAVEKHKTSLIVPDVGTSFMLGSAKCKVLAVNTTDDTNNSSIVLRITYGKTSFIFTGDAEREVEQAIINREGNLESTVLKVGHHGSETSSSYVWLREVMPEYAVISVGKGNSYGHPHDELLSRLKDAGVKTFRTDLQGDIICTSDGKTVTFNPSKNANINVFDPPSNNQSSTSKPDESKEPTQSENNGKETKYILNTNSKKFHYPSCSSADTISDANRKEFNGTRDELIKQGYSPCGRCDP
ncbi:MAG: MBL fold metallo-hydrolase, partial [Clostridia bacterium]|nr:MBL fold metallo-hydrolase [Clostridia bacterium]